ncbi:hypothetical protein ABFV05_020626 [Capra hircus]
MSYNRPPPNVGDLISLKVDNLTNRISHRTLRRIFEKYGPIGDVYMPRDRFTLESRGFAFVRFQDKRHAEEAMDALDGVMLDGRELRVQMARHGRLLDFHQGRSQETPPLSQARQSHSLVAAAGPSAGADRHLRPDLTSAVRSVHLAPVIILHHPRDQVLLEVPSPPQRPDLPQQPRLGLDPEAFHQEESTALSHEIQIIFQLFIEMESSDSDDEEDRVSVRHSSQIDRLAREDDYYRFLTDLNEDYIRMRDNNLLGPLGESTEEELQKRLQIMKENLRRNSDENTDRGDASDDVSSDDSLLDWLTTFRQTENVTSEQKENQSWREQTQISANSDEFRFSLEINLDLDDKNSNPENECVASAKLPRREDTEDSQRQVENPHSESLFTRPSTSEQDAMETLMEVPPTRSQRRAKYMSPISRRTRARTDSSAPSHSLWEIFQRMNEDIPPQTFKQPLISENDTFSRTGHEGTLRQQMPGHELQNKGLIETSRTRNAVPGECYSDTMGSSESLEVRETNSTTPFSLEVGRVPCPVHCRACSQRDRRVSSTQLTSDSPNNTTTSESEQEELKPMFSHSEEANESAYVNTIRNPVHRILNTSLSDTTSVPTQSTLWQTMTGFNNSSNLMDSGSNLEHSVSPPSENMERAESPNERNGPSGSSCRPSSASNASYDPDSNFTLISGSIPNYISSSHSTPMSTSSSSDEDSEISSQVFEDSEERSLSTGLSETRQEGRRMTPIIFDDSDSWSSLNLDQFFLQNEDDPYEPTGLTKAQIENLALRSFGENEAFKACSICITEYTAGNTLCILPCSHEYHDHCIDHWLAEHTTCPICRGPVVGPSEADNSM